MSSLARANQEAGFFFLVCSKEQDHVVSSWQLPLLYVQGVVAEMPLKTEGCAC